MWDGWELCGSGMVGAVSWFPREDGVSPPARAAAIRSTVGLPGGLWWMAGVGSLGGSDEGPPFALCGLVLTNRSS